MKKLLFMAVCALFLESCGAPESPKGPVVAMLGGEKVSIPREFVLFLQYEHEGGDVEKPILLTDSGLPTIKGMAFEVTYPGLAPVDIHGNADEEYQHSIRVLVYPNTREMGLTDLSDHYIKNESTCYLTCYIYHEMPENVHGLVGYFPEIVHRGGGRKTQHVDLNDKNVYVLRNDEGRVLTFIACINAGHDRAPCSHQFYLGDGFDVRLKITYSVQMLGEWARIERALERLFLSFKRSGMRKHGLGLQGADTSPTLQSRK